MQPKYRSRDCSSEWQTYKQIITAELEGTVRLNKIFNFSECFEVSEGGIFDAIQFFVRKVFEGVYSEYIHQTFPREKNEGRENNPSLAGPVGEHDGKVSQIHLPILINMRHRVLPLPIKEQYREVDEVYFFVFI